MRALLVAVLLFALPAGAAGYDWTAPTSPEWVEMGAAELLIAADVAMSARFLKRPGTWEMNPILGEHPTSGRLYATGAVSGLVAAGLWLALPARARWAVPMCVGIGEGAVVASMVLRW